MTTRTPRETEAWVAAGIVYAAAVSCGWSHGEGVSAATIEYHRVLAGEQPMSGSAT